MTVEEMRAYLTKDKELNSVGFYYKADEVGGLTLSFSKYNLPSNLWDDVKYLYNNIDNVIKKEEDNATSIRELVEEYKNEIQRSINFIYQYSNIPRNIGLGEKVQFVIDSQSIPAIFSFMVSVKLLMKYGELESDNYNGMTTGWG